MIVAHPEPMMGEAGVFDLDLFRLPGEPEPATPPSLPKLVDRSTGKTNRVERIQGEFLAAIPMAWIERAARLPGSALAVALLIRHLHVMRGRDWVVLSNVQAARFDISPSAKRRALAALEEVGLIRVERHTGCAPRVKPEGDQ